MYIGTAIGTVEAIDIDEGDVVRYYIGSGTINANNFDVNATTGVVSFERQLDREVLHHTLAKEGPLWNVHPSPCLALNSF